MGTRQRKSRWNHRDVSISGPYFSTPMPPCYILFSILNNLITHFAKNLPLSRHFPVSKIPHGEVPPTRRFDRFSSKMSNISLHFINLHEIGILYHGVLMFSSRFKIISHQKIVSVVYTILLIHIDWLRRMIMNWNDYDIWRMRERERPFKTCETATTLDVCFVYIPLYLYCSRQRHFHTPLFRQNYDALQSVLFSFLIFLAEPKLLSFIVKPTLIWVLNSFSCIFKSTSVRIPSFSVSDLVRWVVKPTSIRFPNSFSCKIKSTLIGISNHSAS